MADTPPKPSPDTRASEDRSPPVERVRDDKPLPDERAREEGVVLTPEQLKRRRARNIALATVLGLLVLLFYAVTIVKLGPNVFNRPL